MLIHLEHEVEKPDFEYIIEEESYLLNDELDELEKHSPEGVAPDDHVAGEQGLLWVGGVSPVQGQPLVKVVGPVLELLESGEVGAPANQVLAVGAFEWLDELLQDAVLVEVLGGKELPWVSTGYSGRSGSGTPLPGCRRA